MEEVKSLFSNSASAVWSRDYSSVLGQTVGSSMPSSPCHVDSSTQTAIPIATRHEVFQRPLHCLQGKIVAIRRSVDGCFFLAVTTLR